jgi:hypothetical protein
MQMSMSCYAYEAGDILPASIFFLYNRSAEKAKHLPPNTTERTEFHRKRIIVSVTLGGFGEIRWRAFPAWFRLVRVGSEKLD